MKNSLETKYFSLKLNKKGSRRFTQKRNRTLSFKGQREPNKNNKTLSKSNDDLLQKEEEILDRFEETRLAEEALAQNLKMIKKQKTRFIRLQKILSRNVILIPLCAILTILSGVLLFSSTLTDYFEHISFNIDVLKQNIELKNNISISQLELIHNNTIIHQLVNNRNRLEKRSLSENKDQVKKTSRGYFFNVGYPSVIGQVTPKSSEKKMQMKSENMPDQRSYGDVYLFELRESEKVNILYRRAYFSNNETTDSMAIYQTYSGIWRSCNYLSDEALNYLSIKNCNIYRSLFNFNNRNAADEEYLYLLSLSTGRDLIRMYNASACCVIVSYFLIIVSWITAITAIFSKSVPVTLITGVLNALISVFLILLLAILHRRLYMQQLRDECLDVKHIFSALVCSSRTVKFGYSLLGTWLSVLASTLNSFCWFHIAKMQKLLFTHGYYYN